ncbi:N-acylethanolamine-hydrolyzing acid amidase-like [Amphiura filiformis]|uniref:N-acylethanolamine-hydrolyzing acid amidase-like n=1 Tax=Amphiura filiformis TaxID=82378 RepID=UPI003B21505E
MARNLLVFLVALVLGLFCHVAVSDHMVQAPRYTVNLDISPEARWNDLLHHWNLTEYRARITKAIEQYVPAAAWDIIGDLVSTLDQYLPAPYAQEIQGIAKTVGLEVGQITALNILYDVSAFCTSIVAQDSNGTIWHARNLDYELGDILRNITVIVDFQVRGKTVYTTTSYAGHVGAFTGQKPHAFTVTINERDQGNIADNIMELLNALVLKKSAFVSFMLRDALSNDATYQEALNRLITKEEIAPVYYTIAGIRPDEGAVITRDHAKALDVWMLDEPNGRWYLLETNYDHWEPPPKDDDRRDPGNKAMLAVGQDDINDKTLMKVLSVKPVLNGHTTYTTIMSAAQPDVFNTHTRFIDSNE